MSGQEDMNPTVGVARFWVAISLVIGLVLGYLVGRSVQQIYHGLSGEREVERMWDVVDRQGERMDTHEAQGWHQAMGERVRSLEMRVADLEGKNGIKK